MNMNMLPQQQWFRVIQYRLACSDSGARIWSRFGRPGARAIDHTAHEG